MVPLMTVLLLAAAIAFVVWGIVDEASPLMNRLAQAIIVAFALAVLITLGFMVTELVSK